MKNPLRYKYVVLGYNYDYYNYVYRQLNEITDATYIHYWPVSINLRRFYFYYLHYNFPLKRILVFGYLFFLKKVVREMNWSNNEPICFLFLAGGTNNDLLKYGLCEQIKESFPKGKIVYFINDLVLKTHMPVQLMKEHADLVYSYDPIDCRKYGLLNHVIPYSDYPFPPINNPRYDVVFVGASKDRLKDILSIFFYLSDNGVKCCFRIIDAPKEDQIQAEGISYSGRISYEENLKLLQNGNCILDIIQGESSGNTIRVGEAIIMGKKLLTNNIYTPQNGVFDKHYMRVFKSLDEIDIHFLLDRTPVLYSIKEKIFPMDLLHDIDDKFVNE